MRLVFGLLLFSLGVTMVHEASAEQTSKHSRPLLADATRKPLLKKKCRSSSRRRTSLSAISSTGTASLESGFSIGFPL